MALLFNFGSGHDAFLVCPPGTSSPAVYMDDQIIKDAVYGLWYLEY